MTISRKADRAPACGAVRDLEMVAKSTNSRGPRVRKAVATPDASQLKKAADRAKQAGIPGLAKKYNKIAADTDRREAFIRGGELREDG